MISLAETDAAIAACFPVMVQLRPHLTTAEAFVPLVRRLQATGYHLAALTTTDATGTAGVRACAGFRHLEMLHAGNHIYVDDLITDATTRSAGHGHALMEWLRERARAHGCERLTLDSGTHRHDAHRFYFRERMHVSSYHFTLPLK